MSIGAKRRSRIATQIGDGTKSHQRHGDLELGPKQFNGAPHSVLASGREPISKSSSEHDGISAKRKCLHNLAASPDAAVKEDLQTSREFVGNFRQNANA